MVTQKGTDGMPKQVECIAKQIEFEQIMVSPTKSTISDSPVAKEELGEEEVPTQEPQQQPMSIVIRRTRRKIQKPTRFTNIVAYAFPIFYEVPSTFLEVI
jgi:hypothetical protein